jgi:hypothetical protein
VTTEKPAPTNPADLDEPENWWGGFYELSIELGQRDDDRLDRAVTALWSAAAVEGCFEVASRDPLSHTPARLTLAAREGGHLLGRVHLPSGTRVVCGALAVRYDDGADWLEFYLPLGALARVERRVGGYPFGDIKGSMSWRGPIDAWLADIGAAVHATEPFRLALVGMEASRTDFEARDLPKGLPADRPFGVLVPALQGATFYPPTI